MNEFIQFTADDTDLVIRRSKIKLDVIKQSLQINVKSTSERHQEFVDFLKERSEYIRLYQLDCNINWHKRSTDKSYEEIRDMLEPNCVIGIKPKYKTKHIPKIHVWDRWEDGFIEGFATTMGTPIYFIWMYARITVLREILDEFGSDMVYGYVPIWGDFTREDKVIFNGKIYDYGYMSQTGKAIIYEEGECNMQDAIAVDPNTLSQKIK